MNENRKHHQSVWWWSELWWKVWAGLLFLRFLLFSQLFEDRVPHMKKTNVFLFIFFLFLQRKRAYSVHEGESQSQQVTWSQGQPTSPDGSGNTLVHILIGEQFKLLYPAWPQFLHICKPLCHPPQILLHSNFIPASSEASVLCEEVVLSLHLNPSLYAWAQRGPRKMPKKSKKKKKALKRHKTSKWDIKNP